MPSIGRRFDVSRNRVAAKDLRARVLHTNRGEVAASKSVGKHRRPGCPGGKRSRPGPLPAAGGPVRPGRRYSDEAIVTGSVFDLANELRQLGPTSLSIVAKPDGRVPNPGEFADADAALLATADGLLSGSAWSLRRTGDAPGAGSDDARRRERVRRCSSRGARKSESGSRQARFRTTPTSPAEVVRIAALLIQRR